MKNRAENAFSDVHFEITQNGDTGEYGGVVWFGTKTKIGARRKLHKLARALCDHDFKKPTKTKRKVKYERNK